MTGTSLRTRPLLILLAAVAAAKLALFALDPSARLFLGDSLSYLHSAASDWVPPDRSYAYALLVRLWNAWRPGLEGVVLVQGFLGLCTALLLVRMLVSAFGLGFAAAAGIGLVFALGPEQLYYERMVMAEAASLFALACMLAAGFAHVRDGRIGWLPLIAAAGVLAVVLRVSLAPLVLGFALLPVVARALAAPPRSLRGGARVFAHAAGMLVLTAFAHHAGKAWYDAHHDLRGEYPADYVAASGYFRLGLVLPLVTLEDFARPDVDPGVVAGLPPDWNDRHHRESLLWSEDGLVARLRAAHGDAIGNRIARKVAMRALRRDPAGFLELSLRTLGDYFDPGIARHRMQDDLGNRGPDDRETAWVKERFGFDASTLATRPSLARRWFGHAAPWLTFCLFSLVPLAAVTLASGWRVRRGESFLLALASLGLFLGHALFSSIVSYRYLHPFPFFLALNAGAIAANLLALRSRNAATPVDPPSR